MSHRRLFAGDIAGALACADEGLALGQRVGNDLAVCVALCALSWICAARGYLDEAVELGRSAVPRASQQVTDAVQMIQPRLYLGFTLISADRLADAEATLREGLRLADELGTAWAFPLLNMGLALRSFRAGTWDDAVAEAQTSLAYAEEANIRVWAVAADSLLAAISLHRDELADADALLVQAQEEVAASGTRPFAYARMLAVQALVREASGNGDGALALLREAWAVHDQQGTVADFREFAPQLVRLARDRSERDVATGVTESLREAAVRARGTPSVEGAALHCRGLLEDDVDALIDAAAVHRSGSCPFESALACLDAGTAVAAHGRSDEAVALLEEAHDVFARLAAARQASRTEAHLRALGVRKGRRGSRRRAGAERSVRRAARAPSRRSVRPELRRLPRVRAP